MILTIMINPLMPGSGNDLVSVNPLSKPASAYYYQLYLRNKLHENSDQKNFPQHNSLENTVCEMTDIFPGVRVLTTSLLSTTFAGMNSL